MANAKVARKVWNFLWKDNSIWSWIVNAIIAFVLIKFAVYPVLGAVLQTDHPVVAVISDSMQHYDDFETWWGSMGTFYGKYNISKEDFRNFGMSNGFNKGDIIILKGKKPEDVRAGDILVFQGSRPEPIIHRVVNVWNDSGKHYYATKGDRNAGQRDEEKAIGEERSEERRVGKECRSRWSPYH